MDTRSYFEHGKLSFKNNNYDHAINLFTRALAISILDNSQKAEIYAMRGQSYQSMRNINFAGNDFQNAIAYGKEDTNNLGQYYYLYATTLNRSAHEEIKKYLDLAKENNYTDPNLWCSYANYFYRRNLIKEALFNYEKYITTTKGPVDMNVLNAAATIYFQYYDIGKIHGLAPVEAIKKAFEHYETIVKKTYGWFNSYSNKSKLEVISRLQLIECYLKLAELEPTKKISYGNDAEYILQQISQFMNNSDEDKCLYLYIKAKILIAKEKHGDALTALCEILVNDIYRFFSSQNFDHAAHELGNLLTNNYILGKITLTSVEKKTFFEAIKNIPIELGYKGTTLLKHCINPKHPLGMRMWLPAGLFNCSLDSGILKLCCNELNNENRYEGAAYVAEMKRNYPSKTFKFNSFMTPKPPPVNIEYENSDEESTSKINNNGLHNMY